MSKHPDHERIRDSSSETDSGGRLLLPYLPVRSKWREASARFLIRHGASPLLRAREPRPDGRDHHGTRRHHRRTLTPRSRSRVRTQPRRGYPRPYWGTNTTTTTARTFTRESTKITGPTPITRVTSGCSGGGSGYRSRSRCQSSSSASSFRMSSATQRRRSPEASGSRRFFR